MPIDFLNQNNYIDVFGSNLNQTQICMLNFEFWISVCLSFSKLIISEWKKKLIFFSDAPYCEKTGFTQIQLNVNLGIESLKSQHTMKVRYNKLNFLHASSFSKKINKIKASHSHPLNTLIF